MMKNLDTTQFHLTDQEINFIADMHDIFILSNESGEEIHFDTIELAQCYSRYLNSLIIKNLLTKVIYYPFRIRLL